MSSRTMLSSEFFPAIVFFVWAASGIAHAQSPSGNLVATPFVRVQDGDTGRIEEFLHSRTEWWKSFRIAFGSDLYLPTVWTPDDALLPKRLRAKAAFFSREITVAAPDPGIFAEHPADSSRGLGGFPCNDVYYGVGRFVLHKPAGDVHARPFIVFATLDGVVRSLLFDTVGTFGYDMLVTTEAGSVYRIDKSGWATRLANFNEDLKAMDLVPLGPEHGAFGGQLIVVSRFLGKLRSIGSSGNVSDVVVSREFPGAEALFILPNPDSAAHEGAYLLHWPLQPQHPYTQQTLPINAFAILSVRRRERREVWTLKRNGDRFDASQLFSFSNQVDEITFLTTAHLPSASACPVQPPPAGPNRESSDLSE